jgi:hypothetical protein
MVKIDLKSVADIVKEKRNSGVKDKHKNNNKDE